MNEYTGLDAGSLYDIVLERDERIRELEQAQTNLQQQLSDAKDDLCRLDGACWHCLNPEVEDAWRHDHDGDGRFHWHHRLDPGDGLSSDCKHSELYERIWQEAQAESEQQLKAAQERLADAEHTLRGYADLRFHSAKEYFAKHANRGEGHG